MDGAGPSPSLRVETGPEIDLALAAWAREQVHADRPNVERALALKNPRPPRPKSRWNEHLARAQTCRQDVDKAWYYVVQTSGRERAAQLRAALECAIASVDSWSVARPEDFVVLLQGLLAAHETARE